MKIKKLVILVICLTMLLTSTVFASRQDRQLIIGSRYGSYGFDITKSNEKNLTLTFGDPLYMVDMVNGANNGARKGGGVGALVLSTPEPTDCNSVEVAIGEEAFKYLTDGGANDDVYQLALDYPLGGIRLINRKDISSLGKGDFRFKIQKQSHEILNETTKPIVGNRPIIRFDLSVNGTPIYKLNGGIQIEIPYEIKTGEDNRKLTLYEVDEIGKLYQIKNSRHIVREEVDGSKKSYIQALITRPGVYAIGYESVTYKDVSGWYQPYVNFISTRGIMNDINGLFKPDNHITRGDLAFFLKNMSDQDPGVSNNTFSDVPKDYPYASAIDWAYSAGLIKGYEDGTFRPHQVTTRQELAVMLHRYTEIMTKSYLPMIIKKETFKDDHKIATFAKESVSTLQQAFVIGGREGGYFAPQDNVTRAECAKMISIIMDGIMDGKTKFVPID